MVVVVRDTQTTHSTIHATHSRTTHTLSSFNALRLRPGRAVEGAREPLSLSRNHASSFLYCIYCIYSMYTIAVAPALREMMVGDSRDHQV